MHSACAQGIICSKLPPLRQQLQELLPWRRLAFTVAERTPKTSDALGSPFAVSRPARREDFWTPSLLRTLEPNASPAAGSRLQERRPEPCSRRDPQSGAGGGGCRLRAAGPARPGPVRAASHGARWGGGGCCSCAKTRASGWEALRKTPSAPCSPSVRPEIFFFYILFCRGAGEPCGSKSAVAVSTSCTRVRLAHSALLLTYWGEGKNTQRNWSEARFAKVKN